MIALDEPRLIRTGYCTRCGDCCDPKFAEAREKAYVDAGIDFEKINRDDGEGCSSFNAETRLCENYENRPSGCRVFPLHPVEVEALPRCTFSFEVSLYQPKPKEEGS